MKVLPLYDEEDASRYRKSNEGPGIGGGHNDDLGKVNVKKLIPRKEVAGGDVPNYRNIMQKIKTKASSFQR